MRMNAHKKRVLYHEMDLTTSKQKERQFRFFFISDIHRRTVDQQLIQKVKQFGAVDFVIIGGDVAEQGVPMARVENNFKQLRALAPLFFVWGNNDREVGEAALRRLFQTVDVVCLENDMVAIPGHPTWGLCGTDDPSSNNVDIKAALRYHNKYNKLIYVSHTPSMFRKILDYVQPTLMLAGHTHGGQIRFGKWGLHENGAFSIKNGRAELISNGFGTTLLPFRLNADPETHILVVRYSDEE